MVPRPLQKLGGDSPLVSTMAIPLGIVSLILVSYVFNEREREKERERERERERKGKGLIGVMATWAVRHGSAMW